MRLSPEDERSIRRLRGVRPGPPVLSVYLQTEPGLALHHGHVANLMDILRDLRDSLPENDRESLAAESERVLSFVREDYVPTGRSLLIFSSRPRRLWQALSLQLALPSRARFTLKPYLIPLNLALEDHPRVAIALVSEERLRLLTTVLDEIEAEHDFFEHVPGRQRQGGWSAFKYQHDRERHIHENFVRVVAELKQLDKELPFKWLVIGGAGDATSAVVSLLPKALRGKLAGTFREEQFETDTKVVRQGALLAAKAERGEELRLAEEIRDRAMAGGQAALGWDETLRTLADGRVHRLAIAANSLRSERVDRALDLAAETSAGVEVVRGEAEEVLAPNGGIGALLRY